MPMLREHVLLLHGNEIRVIDETVNLSLFEFIQELAEVDVQAEVRQNSPCG